MVFSHLMDLSVAYVLALPIGWSQEREGSSAGLRTFPLVAIASCGLILLAKEMLGDVIGAQSRILAGLLPASVLLAEGRSCEQSRASTAQQPPPSVWNVGVIGAAAGFGLYDIAAVLSVVNFATLRLLHPLKKRINRPGKREN